MNITIVKGSRCDHSPDISSPGVWVDEYIVECVHGETAPVQMTFDVPQDLDPEQVPAATLRAALEAFEKLLDVYEVTPTTHDADMSPELE